MGFFSEGDKDVRIFHMAELDKMCEILSAMELENLNKSLCEEPQNKKEIFSKKIADLNEKLDQEKKEMIEKSYGKSEGKSTEKAADDWSDEELALLIKAVNIFPAGTNQRWEVIASFINQHKSKEDATTQRKAKETLSKAKELQQGNFHTSSLKEKLNKKTFEKMEKDKKKDIKVDNCEASQRTETAAEMQGLNMAPWSPEEQKLLEQALKTHPASLGSGRWEQIAQCIPNRSKKDCMKRYKELAEIVRAKKAAQAAAAGKAL